MGGDQKRKDVGVMAIDLENLKVQGVKINYYMVCERKLWLFSKGITMEQNSDRVLAGKLIHEDSYTKMKHKELLIDNLLQLDIVEGEYVREVKISSKMQSADYMQIYYYLYYLKQMGIEKKGMLNYVKERRQEELILTKEKEEEIEALLVAIHGITQKDRPPQLKRLNYCSKCAYYEFCFVKEEQA